MSDQSLPQFRLTIRGLIAEAISQAGGDRYWALSRENREFGTVMVTRDELDSIELRLRERFMRHMEDLEAARKG